MKLVKNASQSELLCSFNRYYQKCGCACNTANGMTSYISVATALIFWIWGKDCRTPIFLAMLGYPIGSTLAPIVIIPFLEEHSKESNETLQITYPNITVNTSMSTTPDSRIDIAFSIIGAFTLLWSVPVLVFHFIRPLRWYAIGAETIHSYREAFSLRSCSHGMPCTGGTLIALVSFFFVVYGGLYGAITVFIFAYSLDSGIGFTVEEAEMLEFSIQGSGVLGLIIIALLSRCLPIQVVGFSLLSLNAIVTLCLTVWARNDKVAFWILACLGGMSFMPLWSASMSWFGQYIVPSSVLVALFIVSFSLAMMFFVWITGYLYEVYTPDAMLYVAAFCSITMLITMVAFHFAGRVFKRRQCMVISPKITSSEIGQNGHLHNNAVEKTVVNSTL